MSTYKLTDQNLNQHIAFGILCAAHVCDDRSWTEWSWGWLLGVDRSADSAINAAASVAYSATSYAAIVAGRAVYDSEYRVSDITAISAAASAISATASVAAADRAVAAASTARAVLAAVSNIDLDLPAIARAAMNIDNVA